MRKKQTFLEKNANTRNNFEKQFCKTFLENEALKSSFWDANLVSSQQQSVRHSSINKWGGLEVDILLTE